MSARILFAILAALFTGQFCFAQNAGRKSPWDLELSTVRFDNVPLTKAFSQLTEQIPREHPGVRLDFLIVREPRKYKRFREVTHGPALRNDEPKFGPPNNDPITLALRAVPIIEVCKYMANLANYRLETEGTRAYFFSTNGGTFERSERFNFNVVRGGNDFFKNAPRRRNQGGETVCDARSALARIGCVFCEGDTAAFYPKRQWLTLRVAREGIAPFLRQVGGGCVTYDPKWLDRQPARRVRELLSEPIWFPETDFPQAAKKSQ